MKHTTKACSAFLISMCALSYGCGTTNSTDVSVEDTSTSGAAAAAVGGALGGSSSAGTISSTKNFELFPTAFAAVSSCPNFSSSTGCSIVNGNTIALSYSSCSFGSSAAVWNGIVQITDSAGITCSTTPGLGNITRQYVASIGGLPGGGFRTSSAGTTVSIDDATANLGNYQGDPVPTLINGGYGKQVNFSGTVRTSVVIAERLYSSAFDHSISGTLAVSSDTGGARVLNGTVTSWHNKIKAKGSTQFSSVSYRDTCCTPVSGSITTAFSSTSASGALGQALNGKTETLTFTGCGTGSLVASDGKTSTVSMNHCY